MTNTPRGPRGLVNNEGWRRQLPFGVRADKKTETKIYDLGPGAGHERTEKENRNA